MKDNQDMLVTFETAKLIKENNFKIICKDYFNNRSLNSKDLYYYYRPSQTLLQKELRNINIHVDVLNKNIHNFENTPIKYDISILKYDENNILIFNLIGGTFLKYEEALESGLQHGLNIINI